MSARARLVIAAAVAVISAIGIGVLASRRESKSPGRASPPDWLVETRAHAPFAGYSQGWLVLHDRCRRVAVADTEARREQGLRGRADFGAYAGMIFVFGSDTDAAFTMAGVTTPLDITWYAASGARIVGAHMKACPDRDQAHCPVYRSGNPFRVALETVPGATSGGSISPCG